MGGHGGLNILPQKRWNVYNFDNRERVKKDEEAAAREEQIRQQQEREKDAESRLEKLREVARARTGSSATGRQIDLGAIGGISKDADTDAAETQHDGEGEGMRHINLFEGWVGFQRVQQGASGSKEDKIDVKGGRDNDKQGRKGDKELERLHRRAVKEATKAGKNGVEADDEHYKLGYGCLGKDKKRPWYLTKSFLTDDTSNGASEAGGSEASGKNVEKRRKTVDELREERLKREQQEREKARRLLAPHSNGYSQKSGAGGDDRKRRPYYNASFGNAR